MGQLAATVGGNAISEPVPFSNGTAITNSDGSFSILSTLLGFAYGGTVTALADANATLTNAQIAAGTITVAVGANNRTLTTPTAAQMVAAFTGVKAGTYIDVVIANLKAANTVTLAGGTGVTAVAGMNLVVAAQTAVTFRLVFTVVTSGSEAVVIVRAAG